MTMHSYIEAADVTSYNRIDVDLRVINLERALAMRPAHNMNVAYAGEEVGVEQLLAAGTLEALYRSGFCADPEAVAQAIATRVGRFQAAPPPEMVARAEKIATAWRLGDDWWDTPDAECVDREDLFWKGVDVVSLNLMEGLR